MLKKSGLIGVIFLVVVLSVVNIVVFLRGRSTTGSTISGSAIEIVPNLPLGLNISIIAFIAQWIILILIILVAYTNFVKHKKHESAKIKFNVVSRKKTRSTTDLDILYNLLKNKKSLSTGSISKLFKISKDKALEWGRILEEHELVNIEYPAFNDPEISIKGFKEKQENAKKEKGESKKKKQGKGKKKGEEEDGKEELKEKPKKVGKERHKTKKKAGNKKK